MAGTTLPRNGSAAAPTAMIARLGARRSWTGTTLSALRKRLTPTVMMLPSGSLMTWIPLAENLAGTTLSFNGSVGCQQYCTGRRKEKETSILLESLFLEKIPVLLCNSRTFRRKNC